MKKLLVILVLAAVSIGCKNETKKETITIEQEVAKVATEDIRLIKGEFIYIADAAVFKGKDFIYGVVLDDMAQELANQVAPKKRDEFDMVPVTVKGTITPKPENEEGWPQVVTIKEIIKISEPTGEAPIKIESTQE